MVRTVGDYYYNRSTDTCYRYSKETGLPMRVSMFTVLLNFVLRLAYKIVKATSSAAQRIFPSGFDNKKIIKE